MTSTAAALEMPDSGRVLSLPSSSPSDSLHWAATLRHETSTDLVVYTRLSPHRLAAHFPLEAIAFKWLSESDSPHALPPTLERIHHDISGRVAGGSGLILLDAVEFLVSVQGFESFLSFVRSMADLLSSTSWSLIMPYDPAAMEPSESARLRREAKPHTVTELISSTTTDISVVPEESVDEEVSEQSPEELQEVEVPSGSLKLLSSIPMAALSTEVLERRIQQWDKMGFDISSLRYAVSLSGQRRYEIYRNVEAAVRRAVECERRIGMIEVRGYSIQAAKMRFRIMQLTGLTDVENTLDTILSGEQ